MYHIICPYTAHTHLRDSAAGRRETATPQPCWRRCSTDRDNVSLGVTGQKSLPVYSNLHLLPKRTAVHLLRVAAASTQQKVREKKIKSRVFFHQFSLSRRYISLNILVGNLMPDKCSGWCHYHLLFAVGYFTPVNPPMSGFLFFTLRNPVLFKTYYHYLKDYIVGAKMHKI